VLRRPEADADPALFAEALVVASELTLFTDMLTSLQLAEEADAVAGRLGDDRLLALTRATLSSTYFFAGEPEAQARALGAESAERARQLGDDVLLGQCLLAYARCGRRQALFTEAFACTERSGDLGIDQHLHSNAGDIALQMGDIPGARAHFEAAIRDGEALGTPDCGTSQNLGMVQRAEQDLDGARSTFQEALWIGRRAGDKRNIAGVILGLAFLDADLGDWYRAAMLHGVAQALLSKTGVPWERFQERLRQESLDQVRRALGGEQLQRAYARGMALSFDQAIDLALGGVLPAT
jgi:tetratricopeptide (TPR) repeat protein